MTNIRNAYIFIADALRWDYLPESVRNRGIARKTIAASTLSPTSFASLTSGLYPPAHGVKTFAHQLPLGRNWLLDLDNLNTSFWQSTNSDPIYDVLNQSQSKKQRVDTMEPPFINIERELLSHAPYGYTEEETDTSITAGDFLDDKSRNLEKLRERYHLGAKRAGSVFEERLDILEDRGILDETMVIFTSDHGELLGEYASLGHIFPLVPEMVQVPTVFFHPDGEQPSLRGVLSHVDISATIANQLGVNIPYATPGMSAYKEGFRNYAYSGFELPPAYGAFGPRRSLARRHRISVKSLWDSDGGWVSPDIPYRSRTIEFIKGIAPVSASNRNVCRQNPSGVLSLFLYLGRPKTKYGNPMFDWETAKSVIDKINSVPEANPRRRSLEVEQRQHLKNLGYK